MATRNRFWFEFGAYQALSIILYIGIAIIFVGFLKYYNYSDITLNQEDLIVMGVVGWLSTAILTLLAYFAYRKGVLKTNPSRLD